MVASESRRWTGFESRPFSSEITPGEPSGTRFGALLAVFRGGRSRCDPCSARVSTTGGGFESRPARSTRCQKYNVLPDQGQLRVSDRSGTFVLSFKPCGSWPRVPPSRHRRRSAGTAGRRPSHHSHHRTNVTGSCCRHHLGMRGARFNAPGDRRTWMRPTDYQRLRLSSGPVVLPIRCASCAAPDGGGSATVVVSWAECESVVCGDQPVGRASAD
jgi:hypothetical protein